MLAKIEAAWIRNATRLMESHFRMKATKPTNAEANPNAMRNLPRYATSIHSPVYADIMMLSHRWSLHPPR